jgi:hypothetical protein
MSNPKKSQQIHYAETRFGFEWGAAKVTRCFSDRQKGWVTLLLETPKHTGGKRLQIYVTKTGKVRIHNGTDEWKEALVRKRMTPKAKNEKGAEG